MATGNIKKPMQIVTHINNELKETSTVIKPTLISNFNFVLLSVTRYGRSNGLMTVGAGLFGLSGGCKLNFGADNETITITGNGSDGFTITSSLSSLPDVYVTLSEITQ